MSRENEKLRELATKIDDLSKQLEKVRDKITEDDVLIIETVGKHQTILMDFIHEMTKATEDWRKEDSERERQLQHFSYYRGLVMGLLLGVVGNLFVSYLMKVLEIFEIPSWGWVASMIVALTLTFLLIWILNRQGKKTDGRFFHQG